jgi:hypothetical protein
MVQPSSGGSAPRTGLGRITIIPGWNAGYCYAGGTRAVTRSMPFWTPDARPPGRSSARCWGPFEVDAGELTAPQPADAVHAKGGRIMLQLPLVLWLIMRR